MEYLAFDIEAANGYKPYSICSMGIVVADKDFNVRHRENIWINPKTKYNLNGTRKNVGIDLHLDKELLDSSPDFPSAYPRISALLTDPTKIIVGHAVESDVYMLNAACKHYKLPGINFKFICSQLLFKLFKGEKDVRGLNKIADELGLAFDQHNSEHDAWASLMTLKYLVAGSGMTLEELMHRFNVRPGENKDMAVTRTVSLSGQTKRTTRVAGEHKIFNYIAKTKFQKISHTLEGKVFSMARSIELGDFEIMKIILDTIYQNGGAYTPKLSKAGYYIKNFSLSEDVLMDEAREKGVNELMERGKIDLISINDLFYMARSE